jgi:hypothetical protein
MTMFDDRERAFEQRFAHDEEARFRALARRNRLLGRWAADQMGLSGAAAAAYADDLTKCVVTAVVDEGVVQRIRADFAARAVHQPEDRIRAKLAELMATAVEQVRHDSWS